MAYNIIFYENESGESEIYHFLETLRKKAEKTPKREIEKAKQERNDYRARLEELKS